MPFTVYADRLDTICIREYGELSDDGLRTLIRANKDGIGRDLNPPVGTEYAAPPIPVYRYAPPSPAIQTLRDALNK